MTQADLLAVLKEIVVDSSCKANPERAEELATMRAQLDKGLHPDSALTELGWDSLQLTWLLVRLEERFDIDTSTLSMFDLFTVGDLLGELQALIAAKPQAAHG